MEWNSKSFFTDHRILSPRIFYTTIIVTACIVFGLLIAELAIDFPSTSVPLLLAFLTGFLIVLILAKVGVRQDILAVLNILFLLCVIEFHLLVLPKVFHVMVFWLAFIPVVAIVTTGMRQSFIWIVLVGIMILVNGIYFENIGYDNYETNISFNAFIISGIIFNAAIYSTSVLLYQLLGNSYSRLKLASDEVSDLHLISEKKKQKLEKFIEIIFNLSKDPDVQDGKIKKVLPRIASLACETLEINRISIWKLHEGDDEHLECLFEFDEEKVEPISFLKQNDFPLYFNAIKGNNVIIAEDVYADKNLEEFVEGYFKPLQIYSMLDAPFFMDNKVGGVICCENRFTKREWIPEDLLFLQSLSDLISITYKNNVAKKFVKKIRSQNLELRGQRLAMEEMNRELVTVNEVLEEKVKDRTVELEAQNRQLTEYAFINAHLLRAPLARVLGLSYLLVQSIKEKEDEKVVKGLIDASEELDTIIKKISDLLYDGNDFSRVDVEEIIRKKFENK